MEAAQSAVKDVASEAGEHLKGPASDAVAAVKDHAQSSADNVKQEAKQATSDVRDSAAESQPRGTRAALTSEQAGSARPSGLGPRPAVA